MDEDSLKPSISQSAPRGIDYIAKLSVLCEYIGGLSITNEMEIYAYEYTLVEIGTIASELLKAKNQPQVEQFKTKYQINNLVEILNGLVQIRNCLADHFHRLSPDNHERLVTLKNNPILSFLAKPVTIQEPFKNVDVSSITNIRTFTDSVSQKPVKPLNRLAFMAFYIEKIQGLYGSVHVSRNNIKYAVSLLLIATGTCAREARSDKMFKLPEWLDEFKEIRNLLAHLYALERGSSRWDNTLLFTVRELSNKLIKLKRLIASGEKYRQEIALIPEKICNYPVLQVVAESSQAASSSSHQILEALISPVAASSAREANAVSEPDLDAAWEEFQAAMSSSSAAAASAATNSAAVVRPIQPIKNDDENIAASLQVAAVPASSAVASSSDTPKRSLDAAKESSKKSRSDIHKNVEEDKTSSNPSERRP
jgi:hypothetical protein